MKAKTNPVLTHILIELREIADEVGYTAVEHRKHVDAAKQLYSDAREASELEELHGYADMSTQAINVAAGQAKYLHTAKRKTVRS